MPKAKPKRRRYLPHQKDATLAIYAKVGLRAATRETGIPARTITRWARAAGVETQVITETTKATKTARAKAERLREELRIRFLEQLREALDRMNAPHIDYKVVARGGELGAEIEQVTYPTPTPTGFREYAVAAGIMLDKYRLEMGESTDRKSLVAMSGDLSHVPDDELNAALGQLLKKL